MTRPLKNLLTETVEYLQQVGRTPEDVLWVGSQDGTYGCDWERFQVIGNVEYESGFGSQNVASDLVVVLKHGEWLEREEYDGAEGWDFKFSPRPEPIINAKPIYTVAGGMWDTLSQLHEKLELEP